MDYRLYHAVNVFAGDHPGLGRAAAAVGSWAVPVFALATVALWLLARPGGSSRWKLASVSAIGAAGAALLVNQAIGIFWSRPRPFAAHADALVFGTRGTDASFPSDHASAAFAIAVAVLLLHRLAGSAFLAAAVVVVISRVLAGAHYPGDLLAGALVGAACGVLVVRLGRPLAVRIVSLVERVTDPLLRPLWRVSRRDAVPLDSP